MSDVLTAAWADAPEPSEILQDLWQNDTEPVPVDGWKVFLDAADQKTIESGWARHVMQSSPARFDAARKGLDRCLERRPDDPVVWLAWLDLAVATDDPDRFWEVAQRIPAELVDPLATQSLRSWVATRSGDRRAETQEWTRLVELQPSSSQALERLAVLAVEAGNSAEAERFQKRKAEIDHAAELDSRAGCHRERIPSARRGAGSNLGSAGTHVRPECVVPGGILPGRDAVER